MMTISITLVVILAIINFNQALKCYYCNLCPSPVNSQQSIYSPTCTNCYTKHYAASYKQQGKKLYTYYCLDDKYSRLLCNKTFNGRTFYCCNSNYCNTGFPEEIYQTTTSSQITNSLIDRETTVEPTSTITRNQNFNQGLNCYYCHLCPSPVNSQQSIYSPTCTSCYTKHYASYKQQGKKLYTYYCFDDGETRRYCNKTVDGMTYYCCNSNYCNMGFPEEIYQTTTSSQITTSLIDRETTLEPTSTITRNQNQPLRCNFCQTCGSRLQKPDSIIKSLSDGKNCKMCYTLYYYNRQANHHFYHYSCFTSTSVFKACNRTLNSDISLQCCNSTDLCNTEARPLR